MVAQAPFYIRWTFWSNLKQNKIYCKIIHLYSGCNAGPTLNHHLFNTCCCVLSRGIISVCRQSVSVCRLQSGAAVVIPCLYPCQPVPSCISHQAPPTPGVGEEWARLIPDPAHPGPQPQGTPPSQSVLAGQAEWEGRRCRIVCCTNVQGCEWNGFIHCLHANHFPCVLSKPFFLCLIKHFQRGDQL